MVISPRSLDSSQTSAPCWIVILKVQIIDVLKSFNNSNRTYLFLLDMLYYVVNVSKNSFSFTRFSTRTSLFAPTIADVIGV